jgi:hypothetical protein
MVAYLQVMAAVVLTSLASTMLDVLDEAKRGKGVLMLVHPHQRCHPCPLLLLAAAVLGILDEAEQGEGYWCSCALVNAAAITRSSSWHHSTAPLASLAIAMLQR